MIRLRNLNCTLSLINTRCKFTLDPKDIDIKNVLGWGKGGAKVASQKNCAIVKHIPTKITVKCHDTRSLERNISIGIARLTDTVELHLFGEESSVAVKAAKRIQQNKEKHEQAVEDIQGKTEVNRLKRLKTEALRQIELDRVLKMGLAYVPVEAKAEASAPEKDVESEEVYDDIELPLPQSDSPGTTLIDTSNSESRNSLKSKFGTFGKK